MKSVCFLLVMACSFACAAQGDRIGIFDRAADIGRPKNAGASRYDATTQSYFMKGSGANIWFNRDEFQYLYKKTGGDFLLTANFEFVGAAGNAHRKIGWMIRESPDEGAASVNAVIHGDGLTVLQWRPLRGAFMRDPEDEVFFAKKTVFRTMQLERSGRKVTMRVANWGNHCRKLPRRKCSI
jgi:TolB protein